MPVVKRRNKVRNSVKLNPFELCMYDVRVLHCYDWDAYFRQFLDSFVLMRFIVLVQHVLVFLSHTARPTHWQRPHHRNKKRLARRLARGIRSQPVINTGHYQRFNPPTHDTIGNFVKEHVFKAFICIRRNTSLCSKHKQQRRLLTKSQQFFRKINHKRLQSRGNRHNHTMGKYHTMNGQTWFISDLINKKAKPH